MTTADANFVAESPNDPTTRGGTMTGSTRSPPLAGVTVLELGTMYAAPDGGPDAARLRGAGDQGGGPEVG